MSGRRLSGAPWCLLALLAFAGCATVDVFQYVPQPLPLGSRPLAVVHSSLEEVTNVSWSRAQHRRIPGQRAQVGADGRGVAAFPEVTPWMPVAPLYLTYGEIARGVQAVTHFNGTWTVLIRDRNGQEIELQFSSRRAARLFLDAATVLAPQTG